MPVKILLVEDDEDDYLLIHEALQPMDGFQLFWCNSFEKAVKHLEDHRCDICIIDYYLGSHSGLDFVRKAIALEFDGPLLVYTGLQYNERIVEKTLLAGVDDYFTKKEISSNVIKRIILYNIKRKKAELQRQQGEARYRQLVELSNMIYEDLKQVHEEAARSLELADNMVETLDRGGFNWLAIPEEARPIPALREINQRIIEKLDSIEQTLAMQQTAMHLREGTEYPVLEIAREAFRLFHKKIICMEVDVTLSGSEEIYTTFNRGALLHIFVNLIQSSLDALLESPEKVIRFEVSQTNTMVVRLFYTSAEVTAKALGHIFSHQFRESPGKYGAGLHFCWQLLESEGGTIAAQSHATGKGTMFQITIPDRSDDV